MLRERLCRTVIETFPRFFFNHWATKKLAKRRWKRARIGSASGKRNSLCTKEKFQLCFPHSHYKPSISSTEQEQLKSVKQEAREEQRTRLFPKQESVANIMRVSQSNKSLKERVNQAQVDWNSARKHRARNELFKCLEYYCLLSRQRSDSE